MQRSGDSTLTPGLQHSSIVSLQRDLRNSGEITRQWKRLVPSYYGLLVPYTLIIIIQIIVLLISLPPSLLPPSTQVYCHRDTAVLEDISTMKESSEERLLMY